MQIGPYEVDLRPIRPSAKAMLEQAWWRAHDFEEGEDGPILKASPPEAVQSILGAAALGMAWSCETLELPSLRSVGYDALALGEQVLDALLPHVPMKDIVEAAYPLLAPILKDLYSPDDEEEALADFSEAPEEGATSAG